MTVRRLHSLLGLWAAVLLVVLALSGAVLSLEPVLERAGNTASAYGQTSVAALAGRVAQHYPGVEQIQRSPNGSLIVYYSQDGQTGVDRVDPHTGQGMNGTYLALRSCPCSATSRRASSRGTFSHG